jgi:hypothetical protein
MILQILIGSLVGVGFGVTLFWRRLKNLFAQLLPRGRKPGNGND